MLRDYQEDICLRVQETLKHQRSVMVQMPTGTGKTVVLASLVSRLGMTDVLIVAHRRELIEQIKETIRAKGYRGLTGETGIVVESIQTVSRRLSSDGNVTPSSGGLGDFSLVVIDEAHHAAAKTYRMLWEAWPEAKFLGFTATPYRLSGDGFTDLFDALVDSWPVKRFIADGWLSAYDYYSIRPDSEDQILIDSLKKRGADGDFLMKELHETLDVAPCIKRLFDSFQRFAFDKKGIVYAIDIAHAEHIAAYYRAQGVNAVAISSKTPLDVRKQVISVFRHHRLKPGRPGMYGQASSLPCGGACGVPAQQSSDGLCTGGAAVQVMVSVDLFSEGFDCPDVEFIQLARPTLSLAKYLQMVGRGLRAHEGKECCVMIDNVGLYRRFGLPSTDRDWKEYFLGNRGWALKKAGQGNAFCWQEGLSIRGEGDEVLVKIVGHEGMVARFSNLRNTGFERRKQGKQWIWEDTVTGILFGRHPAVVDFRGVEMMTEDGVTYYPRIRSKWIDGKCGISRKALETQVGRGFGWMRRYVSLDEPDKVYELQEVTGNYMRVYKDEHGGVFFQQDPDCPLVRERDAGGKEAFMVSCDAKLAEWEDRVTERRHRGFLCAGEHSDGWILPKAVRIEEDGDFNKVVPLSPDGGCLQGENKVFWFDRSTGYTYLHRPEVRQRGFVKLVYDGDLVYVMNIYEERFIPYHNWEIRADNEICTIGNKLYLRSDKDGRALSIKRRRDDFLLFVVSKRMVDYSRIRSITEDAKRRIVFD